MSLTVSFLSPIVVVVFAVLGFNPESYVCWQALYRGALPQSSFYYFLEVL